MHLQHRRDEQIRVLLTGDKVLIQLRGAHVGTPICSLNRFEVERHASVSAQDIPEDICAGTLEVDVLILVVICLSIVPHLLLRLDHCGEHRFIIEDVSRTICDPVAEKEDAAASLKLWRLLRDQLVCHRLCDFLVPQNRLHTVD